MLASSSPEQEVTLGTGITVVTAIVGMFFLGMGVYALAAPQAILRPFDYVLTSASSRAEVRGVYGGFGLAIAAVLAYATVAPAQVRTGVLLTVGAALAGMAVGRAVSAVFDERTPFYPNWFYFLVEAVGAGVLFWAG
ncbi:DUF4345 domain-containing protein [Mycolicibacterium goodii]|uniref:DUF4345 domain-containing protein n=1 Tax=Mycolicibacterium goodii TaxID=134601 RepID=A0ABS6HJV0_MYCGD|nr:DUF4345 domain-containing protein [Mycolicibacterium goodii]MBU8822961.1 DUF4345 domain-containing protein [Mycolicibacterium goodii]MBU8839759.1 DUF4345 domain-containing protein [Mycolicibacterium goodii]